MVRSITGILALLVLAFALSAQDADPVKDKLFAANRAFDTEMKQVRKQAGEWFDKREEAARDAGDKKLVEQFKAERVEYEDGWVLPTTAPAALKAKQDQAFEVLEAAYTQAAKDYAKANKAAEAAAVEAELKNMRLLSGRDKDPVRDRLLAAKSAYESEMRQFHKQVEDWFDRREDKARDAGDKKAVDQIKAERGVYDNDGGLPKTAPAAFKAKQDKAAKALDAAYTQAVTDYTKAKKDAEAAAVEVERKNPGIRPNSVDLLALIDPKAGAVLGEWKRDGKFVVGVNPQFPGVLQLPYEPSEEYDLEATVRRLSGKEYFAFQLVAGGKRVNVAIDTWPTKGYFSGMSEINGKGLFDNGTALKGQLIKNDASFTMLCSVRSGKIDVSFDGKAIISYRGEFNRFSIHSDFRVPNEKALAIQIGYTSPFKIERLVVTPIKGKGTVLK